jgi:hypothetical protein
MIRTLVVVAALALAGLARGAETYPTKPDAMDELCQAIGESPNSTVGPRERLWFKKNCDCPDEKLGCGRPGSKRFTSRIEAAVAELRAARAAEEKRVQEEAFKKYVEAQANARVLVYDPSADYQRCMRRVDKTDPDRNAKWDECRKTLDSAPRESKEPQKDYWTCTQFVDNDAPDHAERWAICKKGLDDALAAQPSEPNP